MSFSKVKWLLILVATISLLHTGFPAPAQATELCIDYKTEVECGKHAPRCSWVASSAYGAYCQYQGIYGVTDY